MAAVALTQVENKNRVCDALEDRINDLEMDRDFLIGIGGSAGRIAEYAARIAHLTRALESVRPAVCA